MLAAAAQAIEEFHSIGPAQVAHLNEEAPFQLSNPIIAAKRDSQNLDARDMVPLILSRTTISSYCALTESPKTTLVPHVTTVNGVVTTITSTICDCSLSPAPNAGNKAVLSVVVQTTTIDGVVKTITTTVCDSTETAKNGNYVAPAASTNNVPPAAAPAIAQGTVVASAAPGKPTVAAGNPAQAPGAETLHSVAAESVPPAGANTEAGAAEGTANATPAAILVSASTSTVPSVTQSFEGSAARGFSLGGVLVAVGLLLV